MEWLKVEPGREAAAAGEALRTLRSGGVIVFPAERLYGLAADARDREAVLRVFRLKGRASAVPLPTIVADLAAAEAWVEMPGPARALARVFWPGPLTMILPLRQPLPPELTAGYDRIGLRVPGNELARELARKLGAPITATSANLSGQDPGRTAEEAVAGLHGPADLVLDAGPLPGPPGSTVIRVRGEEVEIVRPGIISRQELDRIWGGQVRV